jgi:CRP-like cAMP-binding protein
MSAVEASRLRTLEPSVLERLLADCRVRTVPAGGVVRLAGAQGPHMELITAGVVRVEVLSPGGRSLTARYARAGGLLGVASLFTDEYTMLGSDMALTESELVELRVDTVRRLARTDLTVAGALLEELAERLLAFVAEIPGSAFTTVRQRIARHLLRVAIVAEPGEPPIAWLTQQQLAEAIGSVREVVVRELRALRDEGIVATGSGRITILDEARLSTEVVDPSGTEPIRGG